MFDSKEGKKQEERKEERKKNSSNSKIANTICKQFKLMPFLIFHLLNGSIELMDHCVR